MQSAFVGQSLGALFGLEDAPALVTSHRHAARMAVTYIRMDGSGRPVTGPAPLEDAYMVALSLKDVELQAWEYHRPFPRRLLKAGQCQIGDLARPQAVSIDQPHHMLYFYLPRVALDEIADDLEGSRIDELRYSPGQPIDDPIIASLGASLRPVLGHPAQLNPMFLEYVAYALGAHVAQTYGGMAAWSTPRRGGLAPWQEKRAKEIMAARLDGPLLREMAQQCGLSVGHFSRAFRATTGVAPHQWLIQRRVEAAKDLLRDRRMPLSEVALACGFADQSHFTRTFSRATGLSPGAWRRNIHH